MRITLCGSTRFRLEYEALNRQLSLSGHTVYSVAAFGHSGDELTENEKEMLDLVHLKKIMESDCIMVVGSQGQGIPYIGDSTRREIRWARMLGKGVYFQATGDHMLERFVNVTSGLTA